jgi:hypothetical protein
MNKNSIYLILVLLSFTFACKKKTPTSTSTTTIGSDFFIEGKGMRKIWGMKSESKGLGGFNLSELTYSPEGYIHTFFSYGVSGVNGAPADYKVYRKKINITTGDTVATAGIPSSVPKEWMGTLQLGCLEYRLVPYTDKFVYLKNGNIVGDPNWQSVPFASGFEKVYDTKQLACFSSYSYIINPKLIVQYYSGGIAFPMEDKPLPVEALCASVELTKNGDPLVFTALKSDSLQVYNYTTNTLLASIPMPLFLQYLPSNYPWNYKPDATIITKRSQDGTKIICYISHNANYFTLGQGRIFSTFVYDIASKTITPKLQNVHLGPGSYVSNAQDTDDDGNLYYCIIENKVSIKKITPTGGDVIFRTDFMQHWGSIINLKCVMNKVIVACGTVGSSMYSDDRAKGTLVIAVAE